MRQWMPTFDRSQTKKFAKMQNILKLELSISLF